MGWRRGEDSEAAGLFLRFSAISGILLCKAGLLGASAVVGELVEMYCDSLMQSFQVRLVRLS